MNDSHVVRPLGMSCSWLLSLPDLWMRRMSAIGRLLEPPYPSRSYLPCSHAAIVVDCVAGSAGLMSMLILVSTGLGVPHQLGTATNFMSWCGTYSVILYAPVPTNSAGLDHQLTGSLLMTFSSTIIPETPWRVTAEMKNPAGLASFTTTVYGSGAVSPDIMNAGLLAAS